MSFNLTFVHVVDLMKDPRYVFSLPNLILVSWKCAERWSLLLTSMALLDLLGGSRVYACREKICANMKGCESSHPRRRRYLCTIPFDCHARLSNQGSEYNT
jgi:hypothetical protein